MFKLFRNKYITNIILFVFVASFFCSLFVVKTANACSYSQKDNTYISCTDAEKKEYEAKGEVAAAQQTLDQANPPEKSDCMPKGIGWILCPVMNFTAEIVDGAYSAISRMLTTPALGTNTDSSNGMYTTWSVMRTLANIIFVIAFIIIIFSQITSVGINNYGIKKLLPKLIIAAILVNISYFICAIAVDISNILGIGFKGIFDSVLDKVNSGKMMSTEDITSLILANNTEKMAILTGVTAGVALSGTEFLAALSLLVPGLIAAFLAIATVFIVLTLRQALIVLLVVVSPIAFVLYLLPNTENWFKKWRDMFTTMLMMFPIIAGIFGASQLAAYTIVNSSNYFMVQLMGVLIQFIPLAITPLVMKSAGGVLNKVGGFVNNPNRGPFDRMKKSAKSYYDRADLRSNNRAMNLGEKPNAGQLLRYGMRRGLLKRDAYNNVVDENLKKEYGRSATDFVTDSIEKNKQRTSQQLMSYVTGNKIGIRDEMTKGAGAGAGDRAYASALGTQGKIWDDNVKTAGAMFSREGYSGQELHAIATGGTLRENKEASGEQVEASVADGVQSNYYPNIHGMLDYATKIQDPEKRASYQKTLISKLATSPNKPKYLSGQDIDELKQGTFKNTIDDMIVNTIGKNKLSQESFKSMSPEEMAQFTNVLTENKDGKLNVLNKQLNDFQSTIIAAINNPRLNFSPAEIEAMNKMANAARLQGSAHSSGQFE